MGAGVISEIRSWYCGHPSTGSLMGNGAGTEPLLGLLTGLHICLYLCSTPSLPAPPSFNFLITCPRTLATVQVPITLSPFASTPSSLFSNFRSTRGDFYRHGSPTWAKPHSCIHLWNMHRMSNGCRHFSRCWVKAVGETNKNICVMEFTFY